LKTVKQLGWNVGQDWFRKRNIVEKLTHMAEDSLSRRECVDAVAASTTALPVLPQVNTPGSTPSDSVAPEFIVAVRGAGLWVVDR
jgi:hypothetical protein